MMEQLSLFDDRDRTAPLASRLRPETLEEYVGQKHLVGPGKILRQLIEKDQISSMIFWGPPGVGKTTLARIIARQTRAEFVEFSAVTSGIKEVKEVMNQAEQNRRMGIRTLLFTDEIHRFNKAQQDAFLPFVEKGSIILVGATTENPSFEINSALLSRCKVFILKALEEDDLLELLHHALKSPKGYGNMKLSIGEEDLRAIARFANGDARTALNTLEMAVLNGRMDERAVLCVDKEILAQCMNRRSLLYDKNGEEHYNLISALHKSMRNSDPDAAVYWMYRMLPDAGWGRGSAVYCKKTHPLRQRGCGNGGFKCPAPCGVCLPGLPLSGDAGVRRASGPRGDLSVHGAQIQRGLHGLPGLQAGYPGEAGRAGAAADPQRPHEADAGSPLRGGLRLRP